MVAYSGYTAGAKKQAAKSNHSAVSKYIAAELQKCNLGNEKVMSGNLTCKSNTAAKTVTASIKALADFKNPYSTSDAAVTSSGSYGLGNSNLVAAGTLIAIRTCFQDACTDAANRSITRVEIE